MALLACSPERRCTLHCHAAVCTAARLDFGARSPWGHAVCLGWRTLGMPRPTPPWVCEIQPDCDTPDDVMVPWLTKMLAFLGLTDVQYFYVEGLAKGPDSEKKAWNAVEAEVK
eukprot:EG_transcript_50616